MIKFVSVLHTAVQEEKENNFGAASLKLYHTLLGRQYQANSLGQVSSAGWM